MAHTMIILASSCRFAPTDRFGGGSGAGVGTIAAGAGAGVGAAGAGAGKVNGAGAGMVLLNSVLAFGLERGGGSDGGSWDVGPASAS